MIAGSFHIPGCCSSDGLSDWLQRFVREGRINNVDQIPLSDNTACLDHGHNAGLSHEAPIGALIEHRAKKTLLELFDLRARIAQARHHQLHFGTNAQNSLFRQGQQINSSGRDVLPPDR